MSNIAEQEAEHGEEVPQRPASPISKPRWTTVQSSWFILYLVLVYSGLAIASWTIIAIQVYRPITATSYQHGAGDLLPAENVDRIFESNDNWYRFARVIQSIVSALTLPVTSAACARAAVIYAERLQPPEYGRDGNDLSVRQVAVLADKGWVDITAYAHILIGRWKLYGSKFLAFAMWVTILGLVIQPLQQIFLSTTTVRRPSGAGLIETVDIMDKFIDTLSRGYPHGRDNSRLVVTTRKLLEVTDLDEIQPMLWSGDNDNCTTAGSYLNGGIGEDNTCRHGGFNVWNISSIPNAFLAPLPSAFSTGMIPQAILRINSTAEVRSIATSEFPESCQRNGSYYVQYHKESLTDQISEQGFWSVEACMPVTANQDYRYSPWTPTRHRQDFVEHLYIRYTSNLNSEEGMSPRRLNVSSGHAVHITANTTAGYFEMPNYRNGQAPGPILDTGICARPNGTCLETYFPVPEVEPDATDKSAFGSPNVMGPGTPEDIPNKGPLLTIALALFGRGSMVESLMTAPQLYTRNISDSEAGDSYRTCLDKVPLANMFRKRTLGLSTDFQRMIGCLKVEGTNSAAPATLVENWLGLFQADTSILSSVFTAASFLANRVWLLDLGESVAWSYTEYDHGADATKPDISLGGLVVISTLLAVQLLTLCLVAIYSCWYPRWTDTLDAFSMMRIGSALSDRIPLMMFRDILFVSALDEIPGRMGEAAGSGEIGKLELGGTQPIQGRKRRYECIDGLYDPSERHRE